VRCSSRAAPLKVPVSITAWKISRCLSFTAAPGDLRAT
jgi:hypothetical protein